MKRSVLALLVICVVGMSKGQSRIWDDAQAGHSLAVVQPEWSGVKGRVPFFDGFGELLLRRNWQYVAKLYWPPAPHSKSLRAFQGMPLLLEGGTFIGVTNGWLVQYVNCSSWYDTIQSRLIWELPTKPEDKLFFYVWGLSLSKTYYHNSDKMPGMSGRMGFLVALSDEYEQSLFEDRAHWIAVKGLKPLSREFWAIGGLPEADPKEDFVFRVDQKAGLSCEPPSFSETYAKQGLPIDLSFVVSLRSVKVRWKYSDESDWVNLAVRDRGGLNHVRFRFACSWSDYSVDAVEVSSNDYIHASISKDVP